MAPPPGKLGLRLGLRLTLGLTTGVIVTGANVVHSIVTGNDSLWMMANYEIVKLTAIMQHL